MRQAENMASSIKIVTKDKRKEGNSSKDLTFKIPRFIMGQFLKEKLNFIGRKFSTGGDLNHKKVKSELFQAITASKEVLN